MAPKSGDAQYSAPKRPTLQMRFPEATKRIQDQVEKGKLLLNLQISNEQDLENSEAEERKWSEYNCELLRRMVDTDDLVDAYRPKGLYATTSNTPFHLEVKQFYSSVSGKITKLEAILGKLELIPVAPQISQATSQLHASNYEPNNRVFVVHGHDDEARQSTARYIEKLGFQAIVLHEQDNKSLTIIEKFESNVDVSFAVVLLTPDDVGASKTEVENLKPRARQNVILELGFFIGKLGRQRVCALRKGDVEIPSDFSGVLWIPMDSGEAWHLRLAKEMKAAGLDVDFNKLA